VFHKYENGSARTVHSNMEPNESRISSNTSNAHFPRLLNFHHRRYQGCRSQSLELGIVVVVVVQFDFRQGCHSSHSLEEGTWLSLNCNGVAFFCFHCRVSCMNEFKAELKLSFELENSALYGFSLKFNVGMLLIAL